MKLQNLQKKGNIFESLTDLASCLIDILLKSFLKKELKSNKMFTVKPYIKSHSQHIKTLVTVKEI